jgi:hypothetical protein
MLKCYVPAHRCLYVPMCVNTRTHARTHTHTQTNSLSLSEIPCIGLPGKYILLQYIEVFSVKKLFLSL